MQHTDTKERHTTLSQKHNETDTHLERETYWETHKQRHYESHREEHTHRNTHIERDTLR